MSLTEYCIQMLAKEVSALSLTLALLRPCPSLLGKESRETRECTYICPFRMTFQLSGTLEFLAYIPLTQFQGMHRTLSQVCPEDRKCYRYVHPWPRSSYLEEGVPELGLQSRMQHVHSMHMTPLCSACQTESEVTGGYKTVSL